VRGAGAALPPLLAVVQLLAVFEPVPVSCQEPIRRVTLPADADTNDARAYYQYGAAVIRDHPGVAAQAFYWAHRLSPDWPDALYARSLAIILDQRDHLPEYLEGSRRVANSPDFRTSDSLLGAALALDPFLYRRFDRLLFDAYVDYLSQHGALTSFAVQVRSKPFLRGWVAYAQSRWSDAVQAYGEAITKARYKAGLLAARAQSEFMMAAYPAARADLTAALEERRRMDAEAPGAVAFYDSKALLEYSVGVVQETLGDKAAAREAYARALQEDLSYHQAHVRLAALALSDGDTATAISEYDLAAQIRDKDPALRYQMGALLVAARRLDAAAPHFRAAIEAEPLYAPPYASLGGIYEKLDQPHEALALYQAFIAHASRADPLLPWVRRRVNALRQDGVP
jgi:hypothetical protein